MKGLKLSQAAKKAFLIGGMCTIAYLAVYIARNILAAVSPQLTENGVFSLEEIGTLSGAYFAAYAVGQLVNGAVGDKIKAKYMLGAGLVLAGVGSLVFPYLVTTKLSAYAAYAATGFFLSMIYGPMTKVVSENTELVYATRCSLGYTFASFLGSPLAGVLASILPWDGVFITASMILFVMGIAVFGVFSMLEHKGHIEFGKYKPKTGALSRESIKTLIDHRIIKFTVISALTGVIRTSVVSLLALYFAEHLGFSSEQSALIFTVSTLVISLTSFISIFVYERLHRNMDLTLFLSFALSVLMFVAVYLVSDPAINIVLIIIAIMASNSAATMLWSRYCPGLRDTGMVSTATGFLDFVSYMSAALASTVFTSLAASTGWDMLIVIWIVLVAIGTAVCLPLKKHPKKQTEQ